MARAFVAHPDGIVGELDEAERSIVVSLLGQVAQLLRADQPPTSGDAVQDLLDSLGRTPPTSAQVAARDPGVRRLLPDAGGGDEAVSSDFRGLAEETIRSAKLRHLDQAIGILRDATKDRLVLDAGQAQALMVAIGDVRLVLGQRLELETDEDSERLQDKLTHAAEDDPQWAIAAYYDFLSFLQESLALALLD